MLLRKHDTIALAIKDIAIPYETLLQNVSFFAQQIPDKTTRIVIFSENRLEWAYGFYAGWQKQATMIPVDYLSTVDELAYILSDSHPEVIVCSAACAETVHRAIAAISEQAGYLPGSAYQPLILIVDELAQQLSLQKSGKGLPPAQEISISDHQDTALIIYTSGTTGKPKGVMLSYENLLANIHAVSKGHGIPIFGPEDRAMILLPLHHIFPLLGSMILPLYVGATAVFSPSLQASDIMQTLKDHRITIIIGVPRLYQAIITSIMQKIRKNKLASLLYVLAEKVQSRQLSRLLFNTVHKKFGGHVRFLVAGGAALDQTVAHQFTTLGFTMLEGYGMTEAAPMITFTRPYELVIGSAGTALPGTTITIEDDEIVASGKSIMQGYLNKFEETAEVLKDNKLYTGDLGYLDEEGRLFITGRKKEIIVLSNGKNISPEYIEQKLESFTPYIKEQGVFAHNDVLQVVIRPNLAALRNDSIGDLEEYFRWHVIDAYNASVPPAHRIRRFTLVDKDLPRTRLSKLKRFALPELISDRAKVQEDQPAPQGEEYSIIKDFVAQHTDKKIHPDDHLEIDLALDSLDKVSLLAFLKSTFGVDMGEEKLMDHSTLRTLSTFVAEKKKRITVELVNWRDIFKEKVDLHLPKTWITTTLIQYLSRIILPLYFRFTAKGQENVPDSPCIIAPNHQSYYDGLFVASFLKGSLLKKTYFYAKEKHLRNKWVRFFAHRNNVIAIDINKDIKGSIQKLAALLQSGKNIMIFPEGTRTKNGAMGDFKKTFAILSKELNVPVVPVTINGAYEALPSGSLFPKPFTKISVSFDAPIFPGEHTYDSLKKLVQDTVAAGLQKKNQPEEKSSK